MRALPFRSWLVWLSVLLVSACGGDGKSISGQVDRQASAVRAAGGYVIDAAAVDQVWALPIYGVGLGTFTFQEKVVLSLEADGSFQFDVPSSGDYDYVLALVQSENCTTDVPRNAWTEIDINRRLGCIQGFVSVADALSSDAMVAIPTSTQSGGVTLGVLQPIGFQATSTSTTLDDLSGSYSVDLDGLKAIAKTDDLLLGLSYLYANRDDTLSLFYNQNLDYLWIAPFSLDSIRNQFSNGVDLDYAASTYYFETNVDAGNLVSELTTTAGYLSIAPPGQITLDSGGTYDMNTPISSESPGTADGNGWNDGVIGFQINNSNTAFGSVGSFDGISPVGEWKFSRDGSVVGKQDLSLSAPFALDGDVLDTTAPIVFVPKIRVNTDGDNVVSVEAQFTQWNGSAFVDVPFDVAIDILATVDMALTGAGGGACPAMPETGQAGTGMSNIAIEDNRLFWTPSATWKYGANDGSRCGLAGVTVGYFISGNSFQYHWSIDDQRR